MVLWRGLANVSCTFMCTMCIYGPGCRVELHKTHLHPAGPSSQTDITVQRNCGLGGWPVGQKRQKGNASTENHSGRFQAEIGQNAWNKLGPQGKQSREKGSNFDVSIAGTEITQSSLFHSQQTEKELQEKWWCNFKTAFPDKRDWLSAKGLCYPDEESGCTAPPKCCLDKCVWQWWWGEPMAKFPEDPRMHA